MRVLAPRALARIRALQNSNMPFWADVIGPTTTAAGPTGQPALTNENIALKIKCRVSASDPDEVAKFVSGQQTTLDVVKVILPINTPLSKRYLLVITDDRRTYKAKIVGIKPRHANTTAEILYAQEL